jgi:ISXO2 transposase-like protein
MCHRIRYAMTQQPFQARLTGTVEVDETYIGGKARNRKRRYERGANKNLGRGKDKVPVVALVQRGGLVRSERIARVTGRELQGAVNRHVDFSARVITDSFPSYKGLSKDFAGHETINHADDEWVRGDVHTNTVEGFFSILKRGIDGVYHHVSEAHLPRYLNEFDFRYITCAKNGYTDAARTRLALEGVSGKRLRYAETRRTDAGEAST